MKCLSLEIVCMYPRLVFSQNRNFKDLAETFLNTFICIKRYLNLDVFDIIILLLKAIGLVPSNVVSFSRIHKDNCLLII